MLARVYSFISRFAWLALFLSLAPAVAGADFPSDSEVRTTLRDWIERDHWGVGIAVGIIDEHGSRIISYGKLDNGSSAQVDGDTLFELGSITKTFTALLLQDMVACGEMKLDDPVEKFLPEKVKIPSKDGRKVTLLDLATHTSGLPRDINDWKIPEMYNFLGRCQLISKPGTKVLYSNFGFCLLGHVIELKAGTNFESLIQQRICQPLHMDSTCIRSTPELRPRWSVSHGDENRSVWDIDAFYYGLGGGGALRSSVNDMLKYVAAQLGLTTNSLTAPMKQTHLMRFSRAFGEADLAMPWWIYHEDGATLITHGGTTGGQKAFIGFDETSKRGVVVLANRRDPNQQTVEPLGRYLLHSTAPKPTAVSLPAETLDTYNLYSQFSTYRLQGDYSTLFVQFFDASSNPLGARLFIGGAAFTAALGSGNNGSYADARNWGADSLAGLVPAGARFAGLTIEAVKAAPGTAIDGYVDNVSFSIGMVPEPGTAGLLALGAGILALTRKRR